MLIGVVFGFYKNARICIWVWRRINLSILIGDLDVLVMLLLLLLLLLFQLLCVCVKGYYIMFDIVILFFLIVIQEILL